MKFRFQQLTRKGMWTSPGVFEGEYDEIVASVHEGHVVGQPRAAVEVDSARIIYSVDAHGRSTAASTAIFETVARAA